MTLSGPARGPGDRTEPAAPQGVPPRAMVATHDLLPGPRGCAGARDLARARGPLRRARVLAHDPGHRGLRGVDAPSGRGGDPRAPQARGPPEAGARRGAVPREI